MTKAELVEWPYLCDEWDRLDRDIKGLESKKDVGRSQARMDRRLEDLKKRKDVLNARIERIENAVYSLPSVEQRLIVLRYCEKDSWQRIALELTFSCEYVRGRLHKHALSLLKDL